MNNRNGVRIFLVTTAFITFLNTPPAWSLDNYTTPTGETLVSGAATFDRPAQGRLNVNQSSNRAIINWDNFDTGRKARTEFIQPNSSSLTVNRVTGAGSDPTQILGTLKANGNIMILDRNGVLFGNKSVVDVNSIIASTGDVDDSSVTGGDTKFTFDNFGDGVLDMRGKITVADAGLAAFVAPSIRNSGTITAKLGRVEMAAGGTAATVDLYGDDLIQLAFGFEGQGQITNSGKILAENGTINMTTELANDIVNSSINMSGVADVSSVTRDGGKIILNSGADFNLPSSGVLKADSATKHGGSIDIRMNNHAQLDGTLTASSATGGGFIRVSRGGGGITLGRKGKIISNSSQGKGGDVELGGEAGQLTIDGNISSSGATGGGLINLENGDDPVVVHKTAKVLTEARDSGKGGNIEVSSGEGGHEISGNLSSLGKEGGGDIRVISRAGIDILKPSIIESRATGSGTGGNMRFFVSEGVLRHDGKIISAGPQGGGNILFNGDATVNLAKGSSVSSISTAQNKGGNITMDVGRINAKGLVDASGSQGGGTVLLSGFAGVDLSGRVKADALQAGNGGTVDLQSVLTAVNFSGDISARGGPVSGDGGTVTFSTPNVIQPGGTVDVSAPNGNPGTFTH